MKVQAAQSLVRIRQQHDYHDEDFIFTNASRPGYPLYAKFIGNRMARLLRIAGLSPSLTPHSLRHTHVSLLAKAGVSLEQIMERLGHCDDDTTRKVYLHVTKKMKRRPLISSVN